MEGFLPVFLGLASHDDSENCTDIGPQEICSEDFEKIYDFRIEVKEAYEKNDNELVWKKLNDEKVVNIIIQCIGSARVTNIER